jgi:hypothetical protein
MTINSFSGTIVPREFMAKWRHIIPNIIFWSNFWSLKKYVRFWIKMLLVDEKAPHWALHIIGKVTKRINSHTSA